MLVLLTFGGDNGMETHTDRFSLSLNDLAADTTTYLYEYPVNLFVRVWWSDVRLRAMGVKKGCQGV